MYENIIAIHNILKKKNYIVKFLTSSIFKKISKDNFETNFYKKKKKKNTKPNKFLLKKKEKKKNKKKKKKKKTTTVNIPRVLEFFNYILYI
jgi:hypothetical protein